MSDPEQALSGAVLRILRAMVRILLRYGMPFDGFVELTKRMYVEVAQKEFPPPRRKQSVSRISTLTGIYRREVSRILALPPIDDSYIIERYNRAARVVSGWMTDSEYTDSEGQTRALKISGDRPSFTHLVQKYSGDIPVRAILDELIRVGVVVSDEEDRVHLLSRAYIPRHGEADMIGILGTDVADLIGTIDHNLQSPASGNRLQLKVAYDNLPVEAIPEFRRLSSERSHELLEEFNRWLAQRDRDSNPNAPGTGRKRAGLGVYYFEEDQHGDQDR